jgi:type 1 fimbria pilin
MTKTLLILILSTTLVSLHANAFCILDTSAEGGTSPTTLQIPDQVVTIDADLPADSSNKIAYSDSNVQNPRVSYIQCVQGDLYGKQSMPVLGAPLGNGLYATNIDGLAIKPLWNNGVVFGTFPSQGTISYDGVTDPSQIGRLIWPVGSFFRIELYKIKDKITLQNPSGDDVLPPGLIAYNWVNQNSQSNFAQRLQIGLIRIISTPTCRFDGPQLVDFDTVGNEGLATGVSRPLKFSMNCKTDYGSYSASAAITTTSATRDGKYIKVRDNNGQDDRLQIRINDSLGRQLNVDGSMAEQRINLNSNTPAEFDWQAVLMGTNTALRPASGQFSATAEIILQMN